jgi:MFS family permease
MKSRNIPLFVAFRVLFNARFYYPILGVLFLDLGLTLEQYALLNVVWAVTIVTLEIPSGALADVIGRKRMVVVAAGLMVAELAIFSFAPTGNATLLFWLLVINRVLSGAAEASASGADEALAYDSLPPGDRGEGWPNVLATLTRWQSGAFFVAMVVGGALYDADFLGNVAGWIGADWRPVAADVARWPVYVTFAMSVGCLGVALAMREVPRVRAGDDDVASPVGEAVANVWAGAKFVSTDRRILLVLLAAVVCDSLVRLFLTFESNYLRLIELPEVLFGVIGAGMALLGFVAAPVARKMVRGGSAPRNFAGLGGLMLVGLIAVAFAVPGWGVLAVVPLGAAFPMLSFFVSHYLNSWTASELRATVLSFRGVAFNLAYGAVGLLFAGLTGRLRAASPGASGNAVFAEAILWLPGTFVVAAAGVAAFALASRGRITKARGE